MARHCLHWVEGDGDCCKCGEPVVFDPDMPIEEAESVVCPGRRPPAHVGVEEET